MKYLTTQLHGIDLKKQSEFSLMQSEVKSLIKTLYLSVAQDNERKYIGICRDLNFKFIPLGRRLIYDSIWNI
jgi:hypothetical protein